jgi:hypothetical protein
VGCGEGGHRRGSSCEEGWRNLGRDVFRVVASLEDNWTTMREIALQADQWPRYRDLFHP